MDTPSTLTNAARRVLDEPDPHTKAKLTHAFADAWAAGTITTVGDTPPPLSPARPARPELRRPGDMPKRSKSGTKGRIALVHAIAHIELNAIDLAWDIVVRFASLDLPKAFYDDWVEVARDEARHFEMLAARLTDLGAAYGDLPAHDSLWEAAEITQDDILARLGLVPMLLEARGLDTTPMTVERLRLNGDDATAAIMEMIGHDEVSHVKAGVCWFEHVCRTRGLDSLAEFRRLLETRFTGRLQGPFNVEARDQAGMRRAYYAPDSLAPNSLESGPGGG